MSRLVFILITGFWLTMNILLWQTEFGSRKSTGTVPLETVWEKILTAADDSSLTIYRNGKLVGACHLRTGVGEEWSRISDANVPTGPPERNHGYRLQLDGSAVMTELTNRIRFNGELKLDRNRQWEELACQIAIRPSTWEIHSVAAEHNVHLKALNGPGAFEMVLDSADLQNPGRLLSKVLGPLAGDFAGEAGLATPNHNTASLVSGIHWDAYEDSIRIGHTTVQVYRIHTRLLERYEINILVSRAGEILRVDLPEGVRMMNDRLSSAMESRHSAQGNTKNPPVGRRTSESND